MSSRKKSKSLGKGSAAAAKDASWEFSAPKFHDFTKIESEEDANAEQQWFGAFPHFLCSARLMRRLAAGLLVWRRMPLRASLTRSTAHIIRC